MHQKHLESFLAVYEAGNVTQAAQQLNISQPALSRRLNELQELLGVRLFEPLGRGIRPSADARRLLPELTDACNAMQELVRSASAVSGTLSGEIIVGATPQLIETVLSSFLPVFSKQHPGISLVLTEGGGTELQRRLVNREITIAITAEPGVESGLKIHHLWSMDLLAVGNFSKQPKAQGEIALEELGGYDLLTLNDRYQSRNVLEAAFRLEGIRPSIVYESSSTHTLIALSKVDRGIAVVPSTARTGAGSRKITQNGHPIQIGMGAIWHSRSEKIPHLSIFIDELERYLAINLRQ
ncbi:MAG: LysR family transcriptional regulator [Stappiaceae bacterium]